MATMINIHSEGTTSTSRLLDELERAVQVIMSSNTGRTRNTYAQCPLGAISDVVIVSSFLHLAVKLQLDTYVKQIAVRLYPTDEIAVLSDLFQMATTEYRSTHSTFGRKNPSLRLIEMFLELGINPNQRLRTNPNRAHLSDDTMTIYGNSLFLILPRDLNCSNSFSAMEPIHSCRSLLNLSCMRASMTLGRFWRRLG